MKMESNVIGTSTQLSRATKKAARWERSLKLAHTHTHSLGGLDMMIDSNSNIHALQRARNNNRALLALLAVELAIMLPLVVWAAGRQHADERAELAQLASSQLSVCESLRLRDHSDLDMLRQASNAITVSRAQAFATLSAKDAEQLSIRLCSKNVDNFSVSEKKLLAEAKAVHL